MSERLLGDTPPSPGGPLKAPLCSWLTGKTHVLSMPMTLLGEVPLLTSPSTSSSSRHTPVQVTAQGHWAGFYGSLLSKFCVEGLAPLQAICKGHTIPLFLALRDELKFCNQNSTPPLTSCYRPMGFALLAKAEFDTCPQ